MANLRDLIVNGAARVVGSLYGEIVGNGITLIRGKQTAATNAWTGDLPKGVSAYYDGMTIAYYLPVAGTSSAATLNLGGLGAKPVYNGRGANSTTTHFPASSIIFMTYIVQSGINSGNGAWMVSSHYYTYSDTKVSQTISTTDANYRLLLSANANDTTETNTTYKAAKLYANPSTGALTATKFVTASGIEFY